MSFIGFCNVLWPFYLSFEVPNYKEWAKDFKFKLW
jgi:hypothetical protein